MPDIAASPEGTTPQLGVVDLQDVSVTPAAPEAPVVQPPTVESPVQDLDTVDHTISAEYAEAQHEVETRIADHSEVPASEPAVEVAPEPTAETTQVEAAPETQLSTENIAHVLEGIDNIESELARLRGILDNALKVEDQKIEDQIAPAPETTEPAPLTADDAGLRQLDSSPEAPVGPPAEHMIVTRGQVAEQPATPAAAETTQQVDAA